MEQAITEVKWLHETTDDLAVTQTRLANLALDDIPENTMSFKADNFTTYLTTARDDQDH